MILQSEYRFKTLNRIFQGVFFITFLWLLFQVIWSYAVKGAFGPLLAFLPVTVLFMALYKGIGKVFPASDERRIDRVFYIGFWVMTFLLLVAGYWLMFEPTTDLYTVNTMAKSVAASGSMDELYSQLPEGRRLYLSRYPNNQFLFLLLTGYYRVVVLLFGQIPDYAPVLLNVAAIAATVWLIYHTAKKIFEPAAALLAFVMCLLFVPYYVYTPYFYTDSISMPFVMLALYLFVSALQCGQKGKSAALLICAALTCFVGFKIKGSVLILPVVGVAFGLLRCGWKPALAGLACTLALTVVLSAGFQSLVLGLGVTTKEDDWEQRYPVTHWVMMGLRNPGGFNQEDSTFTARAGNYEQKKEANIREIKKRIKEYGAAGMYDHIVQKAVYTWSDGNYYASQHVAKTALRPNVLHQFIAPAAPFHGGYQGYCDSYQLMLLLLMALSSLGMFFRPRLDFRLILQGIVFGAFFFFLIWETRSRYLFNFTPVFLLLSAGSIRTLWEELSGWKKRRELSRRPGTLPAGPGE